MNVYGELKGELAVGATLKGSLSSSVALDGVLTIPSVVGATTYDGSYEVTPKAHESQTLETKDKLMEDNVLIFSVPYYQTSNQFGDTVYIASGVE